MQMKAKIQRVVKAKRLIGMQPVEESSSDATTAMLEVVGYMMIQDAQLSQRDRAAGCV